MRLTEAMARNDSAKISGQYYHPFWKRNFSLTLYIVKYLCNPTEQDYHTKGYVAPGKYKLIRESGPRGPMDQDLAGYSSDLMQCEQSVACHLIDYDPNGWAPSQGTMIHPGISSTAYYSDDQFFWV